jgi:hypothetical protein
MTRHTPIRFLAALLPILLSVLGLVTIFTIAVSRQAAASLPPPAKGPEFPPGTTLVPLGAAQPELRHAYQSIFQEIYGRGPVAWTAAESSYQGEIYAPGTIAAFNGIDGDFDKAGTDGSFTTPRAHLLRPVRIALFYSQVRDAAGQVVTWEEAAFESLFRVYLWGEYFQTINEADIQAGKLQEFDVLILPSITLGYAQGVEAALSPTGTQAIHDWVMAGGTLFAQGEACFLVQAAGLVPSTTVDLNQRLVGDPASDNLAELVISDTTSELTFSWVHSSTYLLDDPLLTASQEISTVAVYSGTNFPGSPAILHARRQKGQVILTNAHPGDRQDTYPQVFDALFLAMSERADLSGQLKQEFSTAVPDQVVPAREPGIPVRVSSKLNNYWDQPLENVTLTEKIEPGFTVVISEITPTASGILTGSNGTTITWYTEKISPSVTTFSYLVHTLSETVDSHAVLVSQAWADYLDPVTGYYRHLDRGPLYVEGHMAARLNGDRDIELDGLYPLPADGAYFDLALTLENKEETDAHGLVVTDVIALLSPIVDVNDQRLIPQAVSVTQDISGDYSFSSTHETMWAANEIFFYDNASYLLPDGVTQNSQVYNLENWDGVTVYTYTNELSNSITIPPGYTQFISVTPSGAIRLPARILTWNFGDLQAYDYLDPALRYGLFSQELLKRTVSFTSDPITSGVVLTGSGGTVFTNLGGHPIPFHEYLSSGVVVIPQSASASGVSYLDIWDRSQSMEMRTVSYDIVPFPPPEYHAVVNTTFDLRVDWDGDGQRTDQVLEYPSRLPADLHLQLKSHSNFDPALTPLQKDETLIAQGMFKGLGFELQPASGDWRTSWSFRDLQGKGPDATVLTDVIDTPAYTYLYFQQELDSQKSESIDITATLDASASPREGILKINDGARYVYHQKAVGPSRYEVMDNHVQAVLGLRSDASVFKRVAPVRVSTYQDSTYHFIRIEDPWDPRRFTLDPYLQSYGFGDTAATTYVGGRHQRSLLWARVNPGESTQARIEINNNSGITMTDLSLAAQAAPGISVTLRSYTATTQIEPLFFDFPYLNLDAIPDAWKGVYYFDIQVSPGFTGTRGQVYPITFTLQGNNIPVEFRIPPAQLGIKDEAGEVWTTLGPSSRLELMDLLPPWVTLREARLANQQEVDQMVDALNYDEANPGADTASELYRTFRSGIQTQTITTTAGSLVTFTLPSYAQGFPWLDGDRQSGRLYVILASDLEVDWSGTALADDAPVARFLDSFSQTQQSWGNAQTVEAHGAVLTSTFLVQQINGVQVNQSAGLLAGITDQVQVAGLVKNIGDYIAADSLVTYTLPQNVTPVSAVPTWTEEISGTLSWQLGDIAPGAERPISLVLKVQPAMSQVGSSLDIIQEGTGHFINTYADQEVTTPIGGNLEAPVQGWQVYFNDFEKNAGKEWSTTGITTAPAGQKFLGEFSNETVTLTLKGLPLARRLGLFFDLYVIRSWDGNQVDNTLPPGLNGTNGVDTIVGPDIWELAADGQKLVNTTFSNWGALGYRQAYPGSYPNGSYPAGSGVVDNGSLGYQYFERPMDSVYHFNYVLDQQSDVLTIAFSAAGLQEIGDESWGIDNVQITLMPLRAPSWRTTYLPALRK